ncbi:MAG: prenyltransferase/squalene oxidase repeat-containing protein [Pirellulales bacterium]
MRMILALLFANAAAASAHAADQAVPLRRAAEYLWSQQGDDGGWHSSQYGLLRSGQALTPFVLQALLQVPESVCPRPKGGIGRALAFILEHSDDDGFLGRGDPDVSEYPVYSTSYSLQCLVAPLEFDEESRWLVQRAYVRKKFRGGPGRGGALIGLERYVVQIRSLAGAQFAEANGFDPRHPAYGGWGFDKPRAAGQPAHMDLAHTRQALEALAAARKWNRFQDAMYDHAAVEKRAQDFLRVVQKHPAAKAQPKRGDGPPLSGAPPYDGGFYFSPVVLEANKGREERQGDAAYFRSYATATCDGLLALVACGVPRNDERVTKAADWLRAHEDFDYPEGVPRDHPEPWGEAIRFYHYAARAEAYAALDWPGEWREKLAAAVAKRQAPDGSFRNEVSPLMKEDDPLLCTGLAVVALAHCQK